MLITGGKRAGTQAVPEVEIYDPASGEWQTAAPMATARSSHTANLLSDGRVLVVGGYGTDKDPVNTSEVFDPASGTWSDAGTLVEARADHTATALEGGDIIVAGGTGRVHAGRALRGRDRDVVGGPETRTWRATITPQSCCRTGRS